MVSLGSPPVKDSMASRPGSVQDRGSLLPGQEEARQVQHPALPQRASLTLAQYQGHVANHLGPRAPAIPPRTPLWVHNHQLGQAGSQSESEYLTVVGIKASNFEYLSSMSAREPASEFLSVLHLLMSLISLSGTS